MMGDTNNTAHGIESENPHIPVIAELPESDILKSRLVSTDYKIIKIAEYQLANLPPPYDICLLHKERQALRDKINKLES